MPSKALISGDLDDRRVPTIHRQGGYSFSFYSGDRSEPPHVHVDGHGGNAKFWLPNRGVVASRGYNRHQLQQIAAIVDSHSLEFLERWHEFFT